MHAQAESLPEALSKIIKTYLEDGWEVGDVIQSLLDTVYDLQMENGLLD
jgi:hypothetical protein